MQTTVINGSPTVRIIPATKPVLYADREHRKLRVCAYGRVSTDHEEQATSFEAQKSYYTNLISNSTEWEFAGFFSDEGITGTSVKKRAGFLKMIEKCKAGKIDVILTKSVSRFSRNILDSIGYARMLKKMGVEVRFEQEGIETFRSDSELQLAIMSILAQDDIQRMSKNIIFGQTERIRNGKVTYRYNGWYGYHKGIDEKPEIIPEQAQIVQQIFAHYLAGDSVHKIAQYLNSKGMTTKQGKTWHAGVILRMLQDERYCGNVLCQNTYVDDPISKEIIKNTGQKPQYLIVGVHDGIITEQTYNLVQAELARRNDIKVAVEGDEKPSRYNSLYALSEKLYCGDCKSSFKRKTWKNRDGSNRYVWMCASRIDGGKNRCKAEAIDEYRLHDAIVKALNNLLGNKDDLTDLITRNVQDAIVNNISGVSHYALQVQLTQMQKSFAELLSISSKTQNPEMFTERFQELSAQISEKQRQLDEAEKLKKAQDEIADRLQYVGEYIHLAPKEITEYDDKLVRQTISRIAVLDKDHIRITFIDGREITQQMEKRK